VEFDYIDSVYVVQVRVLSMIKNNQCSGTVGQLREVSNKANNAELKLFLEVELGQDLRPVPPPEKTKEEILLFFKLYDPLKEELRYVGRLFVKGSGKPAEILAKLNELAGFDPGEEIEIFEEIKFEPNVMCEHIDTKLTFRGSQLEDGDIICFQKVLQAESNEQCRYPDVPSFLEYVHNRQVVRFRSLEKPKEDEFSLELSKLHNYDDVVERVARHLGLDDPSKIRLTSHNCYSQQPKPQPIKYRGVEHLSDMLVHYNQTSDILYYEVLDIPLPELQGLKTLKVAFHHATKDEVIIHTIRLPKQSTVGDVINDLKTKVTSTSVLLSNKLRNYLVKLLEFLKNCSSFWCMVEQVELSHPSAELRLLEVFYHKIYKIFPLAEKIENINDQYWTLRAEERVRVTAQSSHARQPAPDSDDGIEFSLLQQQVQNFGEPFFLVVHEGETLSEVKVRIQKKLQVPDEEFSKWKFAFLSLGRPEYLQDSDIVSSRFQRRDVYGAWEQYLGLEHSDNAPKRSYAANQVRTFLETTEISVVKGDQGKRLRAEAIRARCYCLAVAQLLRKKKARTYRDKLEGSTKVKPLTARYIIPDQYGSNLQWFGPAANDFEAGPSGVSPPQPTDEGLSLPSDFADSVSPTHGSLSPVLHIMVTSGSEDSDLDLVVDQAADMIIDPVSPESVTDNEALGPSFFSGSFGSTSGCFFDDCYPSTPLHHRIPVDCPFMPATSHFPRDLAPALDSGGLIVAGADRESSSSSSDSR
ncbi:hypothetical protein RJ639_019490, partial [Escallonia herrerae]